MIYLVYDIQYYNRYLYVERDKSNRTLNSIYRKNFHMMNKLYFKTLQIVLFSDNLNPIIIIYK